MLIVSLGDTMLGDGAGPTLQREGWEFPFRHLRGLMERGHLRLANLEAPITSHAEARMPWRKWSYRQEPAVAEAFAQLGFDVFGLANNHSMDYGPHGLFDTARELDRAGIRWFGAAENDERAGEGIVVELQSMRLGLIGWAQTYRSMRRGGAYATRDRPGVAEWKDREVSAALARLRRRCDLVIASIHWGRAYRPLTRDQTDMGRKLIDWGADVVNGHHPHVAHSVELYRGKPILYSLGNFVFGSPGRFGTRKVPGYGLVAAYEIDDRRVSRVELDLILVDNAEVDYQPRPAEEATARSVLRGLLAPLGTAHSWHGARAIIDLPG